MELDKPHKPIIDVDGVISAGKQFDLDVTLPEDNRDVIYGVVKNNEIDVTEEYVYKFADGSYSGNYSSIPSGYSKIFDMQNYFKQIGYTRRTTEWHTTEDRMT